MVIQSALFQDYVYLADGVPIHELPSNWLSNGEPWAEHAAHCWNYVLDAILCFADSTAEPEDGGPIKFEPKHVCNDFEALIQWAQQPELHHYNQWD
jgi:hypothetical protein